MKFLTTSHIYLALLVLAIVGGILVAQFYESRTLQTTSSSHDNQNIISEIILAALRDPSQATRENPALVQADTYSTTDQLALRVTTQPSVSSPLQFNARLLTPNGGIIEIDPPSFIVQPGTSVFCCWQIDTPGEYTLQLFRPDGVVTSVPLTIRQGTNTQRADIF